MVYIPTVWQDLPAGGTPLTAAELNRMESGIKSNDEAIAGIQLLPASATQAEAEAGTETSNRMFSPLRVRQGAAAWASEVITPKIGGAAGSLVELKDYVEAGLEVFSSAGVVTLDLAQPVSHYFMTMTENVTSVVLTNIPTTGKVTGRTLEVKQHASAVKTWAWGTGWLYHDSAAPTVTATVSKIDFFQVFTRDGGTVKIAAPGWANVG